MHTVKMINIVNIYERLIAGIRNTNDFLVLFYHYDPFMHYLLQTSECLLITYKWNSKYLVNI